MARTLSMGLCFGLLLAGSSQISAQSQDDRLGLPGDNLNLAAVLDIFQKSPTLEDFEAALNSDTSRVNNLDLNNDNQVDYIKVIDKQDGSMHSIVLQTDLNARESQDIAVIFVDKKGDDVTIQMVGDEDLYGKNYVIEPSSDNSRRGSQTANPGYTGQQTVVNNYYYNTNNNYYDDQPNYAPAPSSWVIVHYMYAPVYRPWYSPWTWAYYPVWYRPWNPWYYDTYYSHWYYHHSWNGWWYWRSPYNHFHDYCYGPYRSYRRHSEIYGRNRSSGVYDRTYNNPRPEPRPTGRPKYANHNLTPDRNPAIVQPVRDGRQQTPVKTTRPTTPVKETRPTTPVKETRPTIPVKETRPTTPVKETRPTTPVKETRPTTPVKETRPTTPVRETRPTTPVKETRPTTPVKETRPTTPVRETRPTTPVRENRTTTPRREQQMSPRSSVQPQQQYNGYGQNMQPREQRNYSTGQVSQPGAVTPRQQSAGYNQGVQPREQRSYNTTQMSQPRATVPREQHVQQQQYAQPSIRNSESRSQSMMQRGGPSSQSRSRSR